MWGAAATGAVQTIITLLKKPENRCAAVTMLGKTVEMCYLQARVALLPLVSLLLQDNFTTYMELPLVMAMRDISYFSQKEMERLW